MALVYGLRLSVSRPEGVTMAVGVVSLRNGAAVAVLRGNAGRSGDRSPAGVGLSRSMWMGVGMGGLVREWGSYVALTLLNVINHLFHATVIYYGTLICFCPQSLYFQLFEFHHP